MSRTLFAARDLHQEAAFSASLVVLLVMSLLNAASEAVFWCFGAKPWGGRLDLPNQARREVKLDGSALRYFDAEVMEDKAGGLSATAPPGTAIWHCAKLV